jgi:hypothetical protein
MGQRKKMAVFWGQRKIESATYSRALLEKREASVLSSGKEMPRIVSKP